MKKAERTRRFIIEKAAPILNKKGMAGTSISDIMEATKLAKGGIYGNFESKDEICAEVFNFLSEGVAASITAAIKDKLTAKDKLFAYLDFCLNTLLLSNQGGCPVLNFGTEADDTNPLIKQRVAEAIKTAQGRISRLITQGIEAGEFNADINAGAFAIKIYTLLEGGILIGRVLGSTEQAKILIDMLKAEIKLFSR
jgi:TetR/AcrR family transcriptional regulator, transcriptional repressor for nem operon